MADPLTILIVHAHPDDEAISTGGTLARYSAEGIRTVLVTATLGEEGEIVDPELNTPEVKARLSEVRLGELHKAVAILNVGTLEILGYRDSGMVGTESNSHPDCFNMADMDEATGRLVRLVRAYRPQVLVSYNEFGGYGHPDHIACHKVTVAAFDAAGDPARYPQAGAPWAPQKLYYANSPRRLFQRAWDQMKERGMPTPLDDPNFDIARFTVPDDQITTAIDVGDYLVRKLDALLVHRTQIEPGGRFMTIPEDIRREIFSHEYFTRVATRVPVPQSDGYEDDLFAGLR
jgi:N-acetyl-1-D-myo-inositol-2-amino-2-deoxy-alpha-D-glucopyranoside deacetylase